MGTENIKEIVHSDVMDLYYGESNLSLKDISEKHNVELAMCQMALQDLVLTSKCYQDLPEHEVSQLSVNKIMAHAREKAELLQQKRSFWQVFWKPALSFSMFFALGAFAFQAWQGPVNSNVATVTPTTAVKVASAAPVVIKRLFETPFDKQSYGSTYRVKRQKPYFNSLVSPVSVGGAKYDMQDKIDQKMLSKNLSVHDVETLYFRARKLEKQGYYAESLRDYQFISKNYPTFEYRKALPFAMARCFENLGDNSSALSLLVAYEKSYGPSQDLTFWKDQLKSETF